MGDQHRHHIPMHAYRVFAGASSQAMNSNDIFIIVVNVLPLTVAATLLVMMMARLEKAILMIHLQINSRMDQLISLTKQSAHAEGMKDQLDMQKER